jgi:phosphate/sulfate permease
MKITFPVALGILFIGLKLAGSIDWSWIWVLSPFWISFIAGFIAGVVLQVIERKERNERIEKFRKKFGK